MNKNISSFLFFFLAKIYGITLQYTYLKSVVFPNNVKQIHLYFTQNLKIDLNLSLEENVV
jgi:hypothetical protein